MDEKKLTVGSLFSGIGGLELGLERTGGFRTIWHCEIEPYPSAILAERWPGVPNLGDITKVDWAEVIRPDVLCGGFPCQDISNAGKRAGIGGEKSGLWKHYLKAIGELRPRYVLAENVAALVNRGLDVVLADLAALRYDAEWDIISAASVGAPHLRERIFIVAYSDFCRPCRNNPESRTAGSSKRKPRTGCFESSNSSGEMAYDSRLRRLDLQPEQNRGQGRKPPLIEAAPSGRESEEIPHPAGQRLHLDLPTERQNPEKSKASLPDADRPRLQEAGAEQQAARASRDSWWETEPDVGRMVDGIPRGLDSFVWRERIKALGNAVIPQVAERVGRSILRREILLK
jgi:DNA (cytosine-5)-methyltransferase 1